MALYFVRHGESTNNAKNLFSGRANPSLTKKGEEQAIKTAREIKDLVEISHVISSPLDRAVRTAEIIAEAIGYEKPIETDERIIEYDLGELESTTWHKIPKEEFSKIKGIEPPAKFRARLIDFLNEHKNKNSNILIVGHGGVYRMIEASRLKLDPASFQEVDRPGNASYIELDISWLD
ncbi:MAG TPA: histidine phosphatase family protein [Candidatus Saccharimonadales bacterium]|nr:histidine phosphatase family protein [Candidatus Saccharimonadales bacterium]